MDYPTRQLIKSAEAEAEYLILRAKFDIARKFMADGTLEDVRNIHAYQKVTPINTLIKEAGL